MERYLELSGSQSLVGCPETAREKTLPPPAISGRTIILSASLAVEQPLCDVVLDVTDYQPVAAAHVRQDLDCVGPVTGLLDLVEYLGGAARACKTFGKKGTV